MKANNMINRRWNNLLFSMVGVFALLLSGCEKDYELDIPFGIDSHDITLESKGGKTNIMIYATGEWSAKFENNINWGSLDQTRGEGTRTINFAYSANYGIGRDINLLLSHSGIVDTIRIAQQGVDPSLRFESRQHRVNSSVESITVPYSTNLQHNVDDIVVRYTSLNGIESDTTWIKGFEFGIDSIKVFFEPNTAEANHERYVSINFRCEDVFEKYTNDYIRISQRAKDIEIKTFEDIRALIPGATGEYLIDSNIALDGVFISDNKSENMETNLNPSPRKIDRTPNKLTGYIQDREGKYGFRVLFTSFDDNCITRYDNATVILKGLTLVKESNPTRYTLKDMTRTNNFDWLVSGKPTDVPAKAKYMRDLTDDDMYTFVSLKDVEITHSEGSFTNGADGYMDAGEVVNGGTALGTGHADAIPLSIRDINGNSMYMVTNALTYWRRGPLDFDSAKDWVPRGSGTFKGILVHTELPRYSLDGNIGRYSMRVLEKSDIALAAARNNGFSNILAEWHWDDGVINTNDDGTLKPNIGAGAIRQTEGKAIALNGDYIEKKYNASSKGFNGNRAVKSKSQWWNHAEGHGEGWEVKFSTEGISTTNLSISFRMGTYTVYKQKAIYGPCEWHVEYSTNGTSFTALENSTFSVFPVVIWDGGMPLYFRPGFGDETFNLPLSLLGQPEVYVRLVPKSMKCPVWGTSSSSSFGDSTPDGGTISASQGENETVLGSLSIRYNK